MACLYFNIIIFRYQAPLDDPLRVFLNAMLRFAHMIASTATPMKVMDGSVFQVLGGPHLLQLYTMSTPGDHKVRFVCASNDTFIISYMRQAGFVFGTDDVALYCS
jgi:hypothetical protein